MAQEGDTITYTFSGSKETEDISSVKEVEILYIDGAGGEAGIGFAATGGEGGRVENVVADVSGFDTLYIWVAEQPFGRYGGGEATRLAGGGSSEVSVVNTDSADSATEPFIAAAGGGGSDAALSRLGPLPQGAGARGGSSSNSDVEGNPPPQGGGSTTDGGFPGEGAVNGHAGSQATIVDSGTTITGGGSSAGTAGEVKLSFQSSGGGLSPPDPPSNLSATQQ